MPFTLFMLMPFSVFVAFTLIGPHFSDEFIHKFLQTNVIFIKIQLDSVKPINLLSNINQNGSVSNNMISVGL